MAQITWTEQMSVGVATADQQHRKLLDLLNDVQEIISQQKGPEALTPIMMQLLDYTRKHFADEEQMLEKCQYPFVNSQKTAHAKFTAQVEEMLRKVQSGAKVNLQLQVMLKDWLIKHIMEMDKRYSSHVKNNMPAMAK